MEPASYTTVDGFLISALYYRPDSLSARAVLILPDPAEGKERWGALADSLRRLGCHVLVSDLRGTGESVSQRGMRRDRSGFTVRELGAAAMDAQAGLRYLGSLPGTEMRRVALVGSGGGSPSALAGERDDLESICTVLVSPRGTGETRRRVGGENRTARPTLVLVGMDDLLGIEASAALVRTGPEIDCWIVDGRGSGAELIESRDGLIGPWTRWILAALESPGRE